MLIDQISVILYTFSAHVQTEDSLKTTLARLRQIGFTNVQVSGIKNPALTPALIRAACDAEGLGICATHEDSKLILSDPAAVVERLQTFGTRYTAYPFPAEIELGDAAAVAKWLGQLEDAAQVLAQAGCHLTYHNHHREFTRVDGRLLYERIFEETSLGAELDTYWVQAGGVSVLDWTRRLAEAGRLPLLHLKDFAITPEGDTRYAPIGSGNIDFAPIIAAAGAGGCRSYIIEQDDCYGRDPFEAVEESFKYLVRHYVEA